MFRLQMIGYFACLTLLPYLVLGQWCASQNNCHDCMKTYPFTSRSNVTCRWCPLDRKCHTDDSIPNPCETWMNIKEGSRCFQDSDESLPYDPIKASFFANLSAVAYAEPEYLQRCFRNLVPEGDFELVEAIGRKCSIDIEDYKECFAFIGVLSKNKSIVLSFRGTSGGDSQILDEALNHKLQPFKGHNIEVNQYFQNAFTKLYEPCLLNSVKKLALQYRDYNVVVTGHSLGGAMASLAAFSLATEGVISKGRLFLYTFGMPRVGNREYAYFYDKYVSNSWRIIHAKDIVPRLPFQSSGFYHHRTPVLYRENMQQNSHYDIFVDNEDPKLTDGFFSVSDHETYFDINIGSYCEEHLQHKRSTTESQFPEDHCQVISLRDASTDIKNVTESVCDFSEDFCDWTRSSGSTFNFKRTKGPSDNNQMTGPLADRHNSATGYYIYAEASGNDGQVTILRSPNVFAGNYCFEFYYHMFGADMGSLEVNMYATGAKMKTIFKRVGDQGYAWRFQPCNVYAQDLHDGLMYVEFKARIGKGYRSDIAIDDILMKKGICKWT